MYMKIQQVSQIGEYIRKERKRQHILQQDLADLSGVSLHFLSNLENGKPTVELQRTMRVLHTLGVDLVLASRQAGIQPGSTKK